MTVEELRQLLKDKPADMVVVFASRTWVYWLSEASVTHLDQVPQGVVSLIHKPGHKEVEVLELS